MMSHSFTNLLIHAVFATKGREPWITPEVRSELHGVIGKAVTTEGAIPIMVNGVDDHVHLFVKIRPDRALSDLLRGVKARSSGWVHRTRPSLSQFAWQTGYGAFSVSESQSQRVHTYIANQEEHHKRVSFSDEIQRFFHSNGLKLPENFFD